MQPGLSSRSVSTSGHSSALSSSSLAFPVSESPGHDTSIASSTHRAVTPSGQRPHRYSIASSQSYEVPQYQPAYEPSPPPRTVYHTPPRHGPRYSMPTASSGFIPVSSKFGSASHSPRTLASHGSEPSGLAPPPATANTTVPGFAPTPTLTPAPGSFIPGPPVTPAPTLPPASSSPGSFLSTQQSQTLNVPQAGYSPPVSAPPSSQLPALPLPMLPTPSQSTPPQVHPGLVQPASGQPREYISTSAPVQATNRVVSNHVPGSRPLPPQPQQAMQRVPSSAPIPANQAYTHAISALPLPYAQNQVRLPTFDSGLSPVQQNPLPVPPGPPGPLGPGSRTPSNSTNNIVSTSSPYHHTPSPSPQPSPSQQSPGLRMLDGTSPSSGSLPPSPVPPRTGQPRTVSGRPSLPLPPPPTLPAAGSYQQLPFPQLPIPPAPLPTSQSQQQYLTSSPSSAMQAGQSFHPGPPPRPPTQIADSLQATSYNQAAH
jgi:neural Wiskott-Aldrich syndrome protein